MTKYVYHCKNKIRIPQPIGAFWLEQRRKPLGKCASNVIRSMLNVSISYSFFKTMKRASIGGKVCINLIGAI